MSTEVNKFFEDLPSEDKQEADIFDEKKPTEEVVTQKTEEEEEPRKNRRHRRLEEALQRERESNIALNERIRTLAEIRETEHSRPESDLDPRLTRVFGSTPEGKEIARNFGEILSEEVARAKAEALAEIENRQTQVFEEQKHFESVIDANLEALEDEYNVDLTSDSPKARKARREYLELVQELSPKDEEGMITGYADFGSTFDIYQKTHQEKADASRNKEIASRSMARSGNSASQTARITPGFRGWEKDYNL